MSDSAGRFPYCNRRGRMTDRGIPTDTNMVGPSDYIRTTASGGSLSATLVFPRSFTRGASNGLKESPRFASLTRKPYSSARNDVDPYNTRAENLWIQKPCASHPSKALLPLLAPRATAGARRAAHHASIIINQWVAMSRFCIRRTRFVAPSGAGTPHLPFGPSKLQRSPRSLADSMGQAARVKTRYHNLTET